MIWVKKKVRAQHRSKGGRKIQTGHKVGEAGIAQEFKGEVKGN